MSARRLAAPALAALLAACGGGGGGPTAPDGGGPVPTHPVSGVVYYDENANGLLDAAETVRFHNVAVVIGSGRGSTGSDGRFTVSAAPAGTPAVTVDSATLPPYYQQGRVPALSVPAAAGFELQVPLTLAIGSNRPHSYLAFGDSITSDGPNAATTYPAILQRLLISEYGRAEMAVDGIPGARSETGSNRIAGVLNNEKPAFVLIHYGTNDWNGFGCRNVELCTTTDNLRSMVRAARAAGTLPVVATLIPVNPAAVDRLAEDREGWTVATNVRIKAMAQEENVLLADVHKAFVDGAGGNLASFFFDHIHPNERGLELMAQGFFRALADPGPPHPVAAAAGSGRFTLLPEPLR